MRTLNRGLTFAVCLGAGLVASGALAQTAPEPATGQPAPSAPATPEPTPPQREPTRTVAVPAGTAVEIELAEALGSKTSQIGQVFKLRLLAPIVVGGVEVAPAGTEGTGEVIDAHPSGFGGRPGRLIVSGRTLDINGTKVRIRGLQMIAAGKDKTGEAILTSAIPVVGLASIFIEGNEVVMAAGSRGQARIADGFSVDLPVAPAAPAASSSATDNQVTPTTNQPEGKTTP